jgi:hypothetical protein
MIAKRRRDVCRLTLTTCFEKPMSTSASLASNEETGVPTLLADGTELTKSALKKLAKEKQKHVKALAKWKK